jgi:hypothetical protein
MDAIRRLCLREPVVAVELSMARSFCEEEQGVATKNKGKWLRGSSLAMGASRTVSNTACPRIKARGCELRMKKDETKNIPS